MPGAATMNSLLFLCRAYLATIFKPLARSSDGAFSAGITDATATRGSFMEIPHGFGLVAVRAKICTQRLPLSEHLCIPQGVH